MKIKVLILLLLVTTSVMSQVTMWTNSTGDQLWNTEANWSNGLPDTVFAAYIPSGFTVYVSGIKEVKGIVLDSSTLISSASFELLDTFHINPGGEVLWNSGSWTSGVFENHGTVRNKTVSGSSVLFETAILNNYHEFIQDGGGIALRGTFNNFESGTLLITGSDSFFGGVVLPQSRLNNYGWIQKDSSDQKARIATTTNNYGSVSSLKGELEFQQSSTLFHGGHLTTSTEGILTLENCQVKDSITGTSEGGINFINVQPIDTLTLNVQTNGVVWQDNEIKSNFLLENDGVLSLENSFFMNIDVTTFINKGQLLFTSLPPSGIYLFNKPIDNISSGSIFLKTDTFFNGTEGITNLGSIIKEDSFGTTTIRIPIIQEGNILVETGTLVIE